MHIKFVIVLSAHVLFTYGCQNGTTQISLNPQAQITWSRKQITDEYGTTIHLLNTQDSLGRPILAQLYIDGPKAGQALYTVRSQEKVYQIADSAKLYLTIRMYYLKQKKISFAHPEFDPRHIGQQLNIQFSFK